MHDLRAEGVLAHLGGIVNVYFYGMDSKVAHYFSIDLHRNAFIA